MTSERAASAGSPRPGSLVLFVVFAIVAVLAMQAGHGFFPGDRAVAWWGRQACIISGAILLLVGTRWILARDGIVHDALGLAFRPRAVTAFVLGSALAIVHLFALMVGLFAVAPFEIGRGPLSAGGLGLEAIGYLTGNLVEELLFRGYVLIVLGRWLGTARAVLLLALPFGLFHFPGLDPASLGKMMLTTGAMHCAYACIFLATRSLWAALAMHAVGNTLLHGVFGAGKPALLSIQYQREFPTNVDAPFLIFLGGSLLLAGSLALTPATRRGAAWLEGRSDPR